MMNMDDERYRAVTLLLAELTESLWRKERHLIGGEITDAMMSRAWELSRVAQWEVVTIDDRLVGPMTEQEANEYAASAGIVREVRQVTP